MVYLVMLFNAIYRFCEKWSHRLRGHFLVTVHVGDGEYESYYALDAYPNCNADNDWIEVDCADGETRKFSIYQDVLITGA